MTMEATAAPRRPYAATANVVAVLERTRTRNLPDTVDDDFMRIAGVGEAVYGRVQQALQFLDLVHPDGSPTDRLKAIASAPEAEYRELLSASIREAYASDFRNVNPELDDQPRILDAFRRYEPRSQTNRMVMLFLGLCRLAGIPVRDAPRERGMQRTVVRPASQSRRSVQPRSRSGTDSTTPPAQVQQQTPGLLFGVSEADVAALNEADFNEVWAALGKVARARAKAQMLPVAQPEEMDESEEMDDA